MSRVIFIVIVLLLLIGVSVGCGSSEPTITAPAYADNITEKLILAYDSNNYTAYLDNFDSAATGSVGQEWFAETSRIILTKVGSYIPDSKVLMEIKMSGNYTEYIYKAKYSNESDGVQVIIDINVTDEGNFAVGIWFNSPKLFG